MKAKKNFFVLLVLLFAGFTTHAQVPKLPTSDLSSQVLGILDNTSGLTLNADQKSKLGANNKNFVDQLFKIAGGSDSEDTKKTGILQLKNSRTKFMTDLLGSDLFSKYSTNVVKAINPLKSKLGLAALAF